MGEFGPSPSDIQETNKPTESTRKEDEKIILPPLIKEFVVNGRKVEFIGVQHDIASYNKYRDVYNQHIKDSDVVIMEGLDDQETIYSTVREMDEENVDQIFINDYYQAATFYRCMADQIHKEGKTAITVDPLLNRNKARSGYQTDNRALQTEFYALLGAGGFLGLDCVVGTAKKIVKERKEKKGDAFCPMTRREFIGRALKFGAAAALGGPMISRIIEHMSSVDGSYLEPKTQKAITLTAHSLMDYRNVIIAEGLCKTLEQYPDKKVKLAYGMLHAGPVILYAQNEALRKAKLLQYKDFENATDPKIRTFMPSEKGWDKTGEEDIAD